MKAAVLFDQPPLSSPFLGAAVHYITQQTADVLQVADQMVTNPPREVSLRVMERRATLHKAKKPQTNQPPILAGN